MEERPNIIVYFEKKKNVFDFSDISISSVASEISQRDWWALEKARVVRRN